MKKNYYIVGAGLLLLYLFLKNKKGKQPELKTASDGSSSVLTNGGKEIVTAAAVVETESPLLISPSIQQDINQGIYEGVFEGGQYEQFVPGMKEKNQGITVRYVAGMKKHYI